MLTTFGPDYRTLLISDPTNSIKPKTEPTSHELLFSRDFHHEIFQRAWETETRLNPIKRWINPTRETLLAWSSPPPNRCGRFSRWPAMIIASPRSSEISLLICAQGTPFRTNCSALYGPDPILRPDRTCWDFSPAPVSSSPVPNREKRYMKAPIFTF